MRAPTQNHAFALSRSQQGGDDAFQECVIVVQIALGFALAKKQQHRHDRRAPSPSCAAVTQLLLRSLRTT